MLPKTVSTCQPRIFVLAVIGACAAVCLSARQAAAARVFWAVLNPRAYVSPSGVFKLEVEPGTMYGQGEGMHRLTRQGKEVWSGKHPFTLWEAAVCDDGTVAGYAYSYGLEGFSPDRRLDKGAGDLRVVIFSPDGRLRLDEPTKRAFRIPDAPPSPMATGMFVNSQTGLFVVRVHGAYSAGAVESWWRYRLSTGKALDRIEPERPSLAKESNVLFAETVAGTPLVLVQWWPRSPEFGGIFSLTDSDGEVVWTYEIPGDYMVPGNAGAKTEIDWSFRNRSAILSTREPSQFDLHSVRVNKRITFTVKSGDRNSWRVNESLRVDYAAPKAPSLADVPETRLRHLGTIVLSTRPASSQPVRQIRCFDIDANGRIGFVRREDDGRDSFVLVGPDGAVSRELRLTGQDEGSISLAWLSGNRWIAIGSGYGEGARARASFIESDTGTITSVQDFECPAVEATAGMRDGGFVVLAKKDYGVTITPELMAFDHKGEILWSIGQDSTQESKLFSPDDVAVTSNGSVVVVDTIRKCVQVFDRGGRYRQTIDLEKAFGRPANYPTGIAAGRDGDIIVHDFSGVPPLWRLTVDGKVVGKMEPRYADKRTFPLVAGVRSAPDGRLWTTDGDSLLRLGEAGTVDFVLGDKPDANRLGEIGHLAIDHRGLIYAVSRRTSAVHVFDRTGRPIRVVRPLPEDFEVNSNPDCLAVAGDGTLYLSGGVSSHAYLRFDPNGTRSGWQKYTLDSVSEEWCFKPGRQEKWVAGYTDLFLVDGEGKIVHTIRKCPSGKWLERPGPLACASDGSVAVVAGRHSMMGLEDASVNLFAGDGEPLRCIPLPCTGLAYCLAYDGKAVVVSFFSELLILGADGTSMKRFVPVQERKEGPAWQPFLSPDGRELWLFAAGSSVIERYAMPSMSEKP